MKNLPLGIQSFRQMIKENYLYVDKTQLIHELFARGGKYYFLSRPRRFGKSLLLSTLAEIFSGNKELFKGLWIYGKIEWTQYPVIHLDFSKIAFKSPESLEKSLENSIDEIAANHNIQLNPKFVLKEKFGELLEKLGKKQQVVILIDEYDKPMTEYIERDKIELAQQIRSVLKDFFVIIKASDEFLRFVFITGVSKFSKVSVFSDLNNLTDITLYEKYSTLLGYTEAEMTRYFSSHMKILAEKSGIPEERLVESVRDWYNGYSWDGENFVYNPYSILSLFNANRFGNFWFSTGTPTFLMKRIRERQSDIVLGFENLPVKSYSFESFDIEKMDIAALLFQTGYLTIKKVTMHPRTMIDTYYLSYPNEEVRNSFLTHLLGEYTQKDMNSSTRLLEQIGDAVEANDMDRFIREIKTLFASIPYHIFIGNKEAYYHTVIYLILKLNGADIKAEDPTNTGRIDAMVETGKRIYIMEFKLGSEKDALAQIKEKKYFEKYEGKGKEIVLMGIGFDTENRNIGNYVTETL